MQCDVLLGLIDTLAASCADGRFADSSAMDDGERGVAAARVTGSIGAAIANLRARSREAHSDLETAKRSCDASSSALRRVAASVRTCRYEHASLSLETESVRSELSLDVGDGGAKDAAGQALLAPASEFAREAPTSLVEGLGDLVDRAVAEEEEAASKSGKRKRGDPHGAPRPATGPREGEDADAYEARRAREHRLMLNRLAHELSLREELSQQRSALDRRREEARARNDAKRSFLSGIGDNLAEVARAAAPLSQALAGPVPDAIARPAPRAVLLPTPLFVLHSQLSALGSMGAGCSCDVDGDENDARAWSDPHAGPAASEEFRASATGSGAADADRRGRGGRRRRWDAVGGNAGGDHEDGAAGLRSGAGLYRAHPLSVIVTVTVPRAADDLAGAPGSASSVRVRFRYLDMLQVVTAEAIAGGDAGAHFSLRGLVHGDDGVASPNPTNAHLESGAFKFDPHRRDRPYRWAQALCGLHFPGPEPFLDGPSGAEGRQDDAATDGSGEAGVCDGDGDAAGDDDGIGVRDGPSAAVVLPASAARQAPRVVRITARVFVASARLRLAASIALDAQFSALAGGDLPGATSGAGGKDRRRGGGDGKDARGTGGADPFALPGEPSLEALFPLPSSASLASWRLVNTAGAGGSSRRFEFRITRGGVSCSGTVTVPPDYPTRAPYFRITDFSGSGVGPGDARSVEREVNVHYDELLVMSAVRDRGGGGSGAPDNDMDTDSDGAGHARAGGDIAAACADSGSEIREGGDVGDPGSVLGRRSLVLLSLQMRRLQMCVDLAALAGEEGKGTGGKMWERRTRGRDRRKPLVWDPHAGVFIQRR